MKFFIGSKSVVDRPSATVAVLALTVTLFTKIIIFPDFGLKM